MNKEERMELLRALAAASNAFHEELRNYGFNVSYGLDDSHQGNIVNLNTPMHERWPLGTLSIKWKLKEMGI